MGPDERRRVEVLIEDTLANAARAPFYRRHWGAGWKRVRTFEQFARIPVIDKALASRQQARLVVGERPPGPGVFSSGTTRGEAYTDPLHVPVTDAEYQLRCETAPRATGVDLYPGWTLAVITVHHGLPRWATGRDELRVPWLHDANALAMLEVTLRHRQPDGRRVTAMVIGSGPLKVFARYLHEQGRVASSLGVKLIGTFSYRLSTHWQALLEAQFDARIFDNYSLSEIGTPFTSCSACGALHMGHPPVIWELVSLKGVRRVQRGAGRLVMTTLFPFTQTMPLVRYDTGDVAVETRFCKIAQKMGLRVLGRMRHGLVSPNGDEFVLNPVDVRDALEAQGDTEKTLHPMARLGIVRSGDLGRPRWTVAWNDGVAVLEFEVRFDPFVYPTRARALEAAVLEHLCARDEVTRAWAKRGKVAVKAMPAGTVRALTERYD